MKTIAIIGFGFCGRIAFYHLSKKSNKNIKIVIFDKLGINHVGSAFSDFSSHYILNVHNEKMSAFSDKPKDFCEFLERDYQQIWRESGEKGFVARKIYGQYLNQITEEAFLNAQKNNINFEFVNEEVVKITDEFLLTTKSNQLYQASEILLANSFNQTELSFNSDKKNFIKKLWDNSSHHDHKNLTDETICLIGSGLSAVDLIAALKKEKFRGKIFVISRRGNFPKKHFLENPIKSPIISTEDAKKGILFICLKIRKFLAQNKNCDLCHVVDSIRLVAKELWWNFDEKNKILFLKIVPYWSIFRHRAPASSMEAIAEMIDSEQLVIKKGGVGKIYEKQGKFFVKVRQEEIECDYLFNCLGFEFRVEKYPLLNQMTQNGLLKKDLILVRSNHQRVHLLGGLNIGRDFECTAVPNSRTSVEEVVSLLV